MRRADGTYVSVGRHPDVGPPYDYACCVVGAVLTEGRLALGASRDDSFYYGSATVDVASGRQLDSAGVRYTTLNERGQTAGTEACCYSYRGRSLRTVGFTAPLPTGTIERYCDLPGRWTTLEPIDLDDQTNLLASFCDRPVLLPSSGATIWLDLLFGATSRVRMAPTGGLIVALDPDGALYAWRPGDRAPARVLGPDDAWRFDGLGAVSASGAIAAHGVHAPSGRRAALLVTPRAGR